MSRARDRVLAAAGVVFGLFWLVAAGAKLAHPYAAYRFVALGAPEGWPPKVLLAVAVGAEAGLGTAMCLRAVRGLGWSLAGLLVMTVALAAVQRGAGGDIPCGCFGALVGESITQAYQRNAVLGAVHVVLMVWGRRSGGGNPG